LSGYIIGGWTTVVSFARFLERTERNKLPSKWAGFKLDPENNEALEIAEKLSTPPKEKPKTLVRTGQKRREDYGRSLLPNLPGRNKEQSEKIRQYCGARFSGYSQAKACEIAELSSTNIVTYETRHMAAFEEAEREIMDYCTRKYHRNLWLIRAALSEAGPRTVHKIIELMDNPKVSPSVQLKAAQALLKMTNVTGEAAVGKEHVKNEFTLAIKDARLDVTSDSIVEAEDAEVIEDDESRTFDTNESGRGPDYDETQIA